eukprot:scaffold229187_cov32-Attheya_sp.AAC.2
MPDKIKGKGLRHRMGGVGAAAKNSGPVMTAGAPATTLLPYLNLQYQPRRRDLHPQGHLLQSM